MMGGEFILGAFCGAFLMFVVIAVVVGVVSLRSVGGEVDDGWGN